MAHIVNVVLGAFFKVSDKEDVRSICAIQQVNAEKNSKTSRVSFNQKVSVVLIPQGVEYKRAGCDLWWATPDYDLFKKDLLQEIRHAMEKDPTLLTEHDTIKRLCCS